MKGVLNTKGVNILEMNYIQWVGDLVGQWHTWEKWPSRVRNTRGSDIVKKLYLSKYNIFVVKVLGGIYSISITN